MTEMLAGQLRVCGECALDSPNGNTYLNAAARPMLRNAAAEIERLRVIEGELAWIVNYFQGGIRPTDCNEWWRRACAALKRD